MSSESEFNVDNLALNANKTLEKIFNDARKQNIPIPRYDITLKRVYLEYPDGRKEYVPSDNNK